MQGAPFLSFFFFFFFIWRLITLQYYSGFCYTLTWISHGFTCIPHPDPHSHLPLHLIPLGLPSAPWSQDVIRSTDDLRISTLLSFCLTYGNAAVLTPLGRFLCPHRRRMTISFWLQYESLATGHKVIWVGYYTKKAFLVTQLAKNSPAMQETLVQSLGWEDPTEKA